MKKNQLKPVRISLSFILMFSFFYSFAQQPLQPNPIKAREELLAYERQQRALARNITPLQKPEYSINRLNDYISITFSENSRVTMANFFQSLEKELGLDANNRFVFEKVNKSKDGSAHYNYFQYYKGIRVKGGQFTLHEKNGKLKSANGKFYKGLRLDARPVVSPATAIERSIQSVGAKSYMWEDAEAERSLKSRSKDASASFYPKPLLVIAPVGEVYKTENFRLVFEVPVVSKVPFRDVDVIIDAHSGAVIEVRNNIRHSDAPASGTTLYAGARNFTTDSYSGFYRLQEDARSIVTRNMMNRDDYSKAAQFSSRFNNTWAPAASKLSILEVKKVNNDWKDPLGEEGGAPDIYIEILDITGTVLFSTEDNVENNAAFPLFINLDNVRLLHNSAYSIRVYDEDFLFDDLLGTFAFTTINGSVTKADKGSIIVINGTTSTSGAIDAHWGMERVYDYYLANHDRESYDDGNADVEVYVHLNKSLNDGDPNNAFWSPSLNNMNFLDGDGINFGQMVAVDICGHEFTHGVIQHSNGGFGTGEDGSLGESFSDIFGTAVEFSTGFPANWTVGENVFIPGGPAPIKYVRSLKNPKEKGHPDTYNGTNWSASTMHGRAGVQNKWFYLLANGGNWKIDDVGFDYQVPRINFETALDITYENMTSRLSAGATYPDAFIGSLDAAEDLGFNKTSLTYRAVREAWFAVGVAKRPVINSFNPTHGPIGTTVTISGSDFTGVSYVLFNNTEVAAPNFNVSSDYKTIEVKVPSGATTGYISIIAGYDTVESADKFIVDCNAPLTVTVASSDATSFTATATGGTPPYSYSLDNVTFQQSNVFTNLTSGRNYTVYAKDSVECKGQVTFFLSNPINCNVQSGSGGQGTAFITQNLGATAGSVTVSYQMYGIPDQMDIYYNNVLVASTNSLVSGAGTLTFNYSPNPGGPYHCIIRMFAPNSGTAWDFIAYCPVSLSPNPGGVDFLGTANEPHVPGVSLDMIYPNPTSGNAMLRLTTARGNTLIQLSEVTGKVLWQTRITKPGNIVIPSGQLPGGTYIVAVIDETGERRSMKLIKAK